MCEFEFHCRKLGELIENKAGHILNLIYEISKVFFHCEKQILELIGNSLAYHRIFGFWKGISG